MKRAGNLFEKIVDIENIKRAHKNARKGKSNYREVQYVNDHPEALEKLRKSLIDKTFTTSPYKIKKIFDGRKYRTVYKLPYYPDRIVQHALLQVVGPVWEKSLIRDTFQSIKGRGTSDARKRIQLKIKDDFPRYCLKLDIEKYYPSVDNAILEEKLLKKIKCKDTIWLVKNILHSCSGLPIGNFTSQLWGNFNLCDFDWWLKQEKKIKHYFRYCDDLVILHHDKKLLHQLKVEIESRLTSINLKLKSNWQVFDAHKQGVDFVGYVFKPNSIRLRRKIADGFKNKIKNVHKYSNRMTPHQIINGIMAYFGWLKSINAYRLWNSKITDKIKKIAQDSYESLLNDRIGNISSNR